MFKLEKITRLEVQSVVSKIMFLPKLKTQSWLNELHNLWAFKRHIFKSSSYDIVKCNNILVVNFDKRLLNAEAEIRKNSIGPH